MFTESDKIVLRALITDAMSSPELTNEECKYWYELIQKINSI